MLLKQSSTALKRLSNGSKAFRLCSTCGFTVGFHLVRRSGFSVRRFRVSGSRFRVSDFGFRVPGFRFQVSGFAFGVWGLGLRVSVSGVGNPQTSFHQLMSKKMSISRSD